MLGETGVRPEQLNLEITESVMMQNSIAVAETFAQLKALGIKLYLDDFGTGYSSLSYLQSFPVDALKVDRSFVTNMTVSPERAELIKTILEMARTLKLDVVAEGIETEAQRAQLAALGCLYGQGYLFARPAPESALQLPRARRQVIPPKPATMDDVALPCTSERSAIALAHRSVGRRLGVGLAAGSPRADPLICLICLTRSSSAIRPNAGSATIVRQEGAAPLGPVHGRRWPGARRPGPRRPGENSPFDRCATTARYELMEHEMSDRGSLSSAPEVTRSHSCL